MPAARYVGYLRVSTQRQGASGLGIETQRRAILDHAGDPARVVAVHLEIESGRKADRPELARALAACRMQQATLLIAKLDRLARNVAFVSNLMESGVEFVACDFPQANRLTVHILAAVAEHERRMISERTKAALAVATARGVKLGGDPASLKNRELGWRHSARTRREQANRRAADLLPVIEALRADGALTYAALAAGLNRRGVPAPRGGVWFPASVLQVLRRAG
jgi:DNA invertase Pin-like site-specific DNA recombinase